MDKIHKVTFTDTGKSYDVTQGCVAKIIHGDFEYLEEPEPNTLTEDEIKNNHVLLCIATPLTDLTVSPCPE